MGAIFKLQATKILYKEYNGVVDVSRVGEKKKKNSRTSHVRLQESQTAFS